MSAFQASAANASVRVRVSVVAPIFGIQCVALKLVVGFFFSYGHSGFLPHFNRLLVSANKKKKKKKKTLSDFTLVLSLRTYRLCGLVVKASASRVEDPEFESRLRRDLFGVESYQRLKHWHFSGYPARRLAL